MFHIYCPYCQEHREETEFHYAGQAHIARPDDPDRATDESWGEYLFFRKNKSFSLFLRKFQETIPYKCGIETTS